MRRLTLTPPREQVLGLRHDHTLVSPAQPRRNEPVTISLWARKDARLREVELRTAPDGEEELHRMRPVEERYAHQRFECTFTPRVSRLRYRFRLVSDAGVLHLTMRGLSVFDPVDAFDYTLLAADHNGAGTLPTWPLGAVLYQIFPDRFADGDPNNNVRDGEWSHHGAHTQNRPFGERPLHWSVAHNLDFYGGDLQGIEQHLSHFTRLGVSGLFLNPIWPALSNHRYDYIDHATVDPHLGGDAALASLSTALHARDLRLILDVVINHTGSAHPWFNREGHFGDGGAHRDPAAPTRRYYLFNDWPDYRGWNGHATLPRLNLADPELRNVIYAGEHSFLRKFLRPPYAVDGYRFDVANMMGRDGGIQFHRELFTSIRDALRADRPDVYLMGEHFFDPDKLQKGDGLDGVMAYHAFTFPIRTFLLRHDRRGPKSSLDAHDLITHVRENMARQGEPLWHRSTLHVNSHDLPRLQTIAPAAGQNGPRCLTFATALQLTLPGIPCLYYGDEIGLEGAADPDNRRCMEWDESKWDHPRLETTSHLIKQRRASPALSQGGFVDLGSEGDVIAFARVYGEEIKVVLASRSEEETEVTVSLMGLMGGHAEEVRCVLGGMEVRVVEVA